MSKDVKNNVNNQTNYIVDMIEETGEISEDANNDVDDIVYHAYAIRKMPTNIKSETVKKALFEKKNKNSRKNN